MQTSTLISTLTDEVSGATFLRPCTGASCRMPFGFRLGRDPYAVAPAVALTAVTISSVVTSGCETMEAWEATTSSIDFHAGGPDGALSAAALHGRWVAAMTPAVSGSTSPAKTAGNAS